MIRFIIVLSIILASCSNQQNISRPEIDILKLDTKWSLTQVQEYMNGKYCASLPDFDSNGLLHSLRFAPVYYEGVQGSLLSYKSGRDICFIFFSPLSIDKYFTFSDTSSCFEKGTLPSREYYEKLKEYLIKKYPRRSIHGKEDYESSDLEDSVNRLTLSYRKKNKAGVETVHIEVTPSEYTK